VTTAGYVLFRLGEQTFATALDDVREIVRLTQLQQLPGMQSPLAGVVVLRGNPLPVLDVRRSEDSGTAGDILVVESVADTVGVAVDAVVAVLQPDELPEADAPHRTLPDYVIGVRRHGEMPVLMVDLQKIVDAGAAGA
jgi:chemotaxis signal transduction protein